MSYFFTNLDGSEALLSAANYLLSGRTYRFPNGHRLAGDQTGATMEPMRRDLFRLLVRLNCDSQAFLSFLSHGIQQLLLPFSSVHVKASFSWIYESTGRFHGAVDLNDEPQPQYSYPGHATRTNFQVNAAADGTIVGWDELSVLTLEHGGGTFRTTYNHVENVPVLPATAEGSTQVLNLGGAVRAGAVIGNAWDPPGPQPLHLHFAMFIPNCVPTGWNPDLNPLFGVLSDDFDVNFDATQEQNILAELQGPGSSPWEPTEWFSVDPFGQYDILPLNSSYGPLRRGFYYPVPIGPGTYAFQDPAIGGDPGGDRIPLFAGCQSLLENVSVEPLSMATLAAVSE